MEITAKMVKELRDLTGAGMMDCKQALQETEGDIDKAVQLLREKGAAKAVKKASKVAAEGVVKMKISEDGKKASLVEINTQTDFVAKNDKFVELSEKIIDHIFDNNIKTVEELNNSTIEGKQFTEFLNEQIANIGENIVVRRIETYEAGDNELISGYVHFTNTNGVILKTKTDSEETLDAAKDLLQNITMHISAMGPNVVSYKDFDEDFIAKELDQIQLKITEDNENKAMIGKPTRELPKYGSRSQISDEVIEETKNKIREELLAEGKPEKILDKIIPGKIAKFLEENTEIDRQYALYSQSFILDDSKTVEEILNDKSEELNGSIDVVEYARFKVGEGIEKEEENFAEEVASQMRGE